MGQLDKAHGPWQLLSLQRTCVVCIGAWVESLYKNKIKIQGTCGDSG